jgi:glutathione synthase
MSKRLLMTGDPVTSINPDSDTSLLLLGEALKRGFDVDYCDVTRINFNDDFLRTLPVQRVLHADAEEANFLGVDLRRSVDVASSYDVIIHRKDPPVDDFYRAVHEPFAKLPAKILQVNNPAKIGAYHEKLLPLRFPAFAAPTTLCESFEALVAAVRAARPEAVAKPVDLYSGIGIEFFKPDAPEVALRAFWELRKPRVVVQPFLPAIEESGDLRVLTMNGRIIGCVLRKPKAGSRLANLHQGGSANAWTITPSQEAASLEIASELLKEGLYLLGLDFIGEQITEINITSPTTVPSMNKLYGMRGEALIWDEIEKLLATV